MMYVEFPEIYRCCCCVPARYGLPVWFYIKLMLSIITLIPIVVFTLFFPFLGIVERSIVGVVTLPALVLDIIMNIVALVGGHSKNTKLLNVYYKYSIFSLVLFIIVFIGITLVNLYVVGFFDMYHPCVWHYLLWYSIVGFASVAIQIYMLLLLRSKVHLLQSNCQFRFVNNAAEAEAVCTMDVDKTFESNSPDKPCNGKLHNQENLENKAENKSKDSQREPNERAEEELSEETHKFIENVI